MITIYHNPRCSKSREALSLVREFASEKKADVHVVDYLDTRLNEEQLAALLKLLDGDVRAMVRTNEEEYASLGLEHADSAQMLKAIAAHPTLLQRPIVVYGSRAVIGRPPEAVLSLLKPS